MDRRDFVKTTAAGAAMFATATAAQAQAIPHPLTLVGTGPENTTQGGAVLPTGPVTSRIAQNPDMKYRPLGNTGERVSMIGMGGFHLAKPGGATTDEAVVRGLSRYLSSAGHTAFQRTVLTAAQQALHSRGCQCRLG